MKRLKHWQKLNGRNRMENIKGKKTIALIAHDNMKDEIVEWARKNKSELSKHYLIGTGTTASIIADRLNISVEKVKSGPYGGDLQIGSKISDDEIDMVIFFFDPLTAQPHDPDVKALLRVATLYDIPIAINRSTAEFLLTSKYMKEDFERKTINSEELAKKRFNEFKEIK